MFRVKNVTRFGMRQFLFLKEYIYHFPKKKKNTYSAYRE